jgi:type 1 glutamine amidotransferase
MRIDKLTMMVPLACALLTAAPENLAKAAENKSPKNIVFLLAENEYRAWQTVPEFGKILEDKYGFNCHYLTSSTDNADPNRFFIPRMDKVKKADLVVVFARRRALPKEQMQILKDYLDSGKPLIGIRTASHAFDANLVVPKEGGAPVAANVELPAGLEQWKSFDKDVFGCSYHGHYGGGGITTVTISPDKKHHPILIGVPGKFESPSWLYQLTPLAPTAEALMMGKIPGKDAEAVVLTNTYKRGSRIVYTSLGHWDDFKIPAFQRILINSVFWTMKLDVPND